MGIRSRLRAPLPAGRRSTGSEQVLKQGFQPRRLRKARRLGRPPGASIRPNRLRSVPQTRSEWPSREGSRLSARAWLRLLKHDAAAGQGLTRRQPEPSLTPPRQ